MANIKSSIKRVRSSRRKAAHNQIVRTTAKTYVKKARHLIAAGQVDEAQTAVQNAIKALDKAAQKGVIHKGNAARRKSRLVKLYNQAQKQA